MWTFKLQTFKWCEHASGSKKEPKPVPSTSGMSAIAPRLLHLLLLTIVQLYHLPPPLPPPASNSSCLFTVPASVGLVYYTVLLYFSRYCTVRFKMFFCFYLFVWKVSWTYYSTLLYSNCVSWVHRLTLSLQTNWTREHTLGTELICLYGTVFLQDRIHVWLISISQSIYTLCRIVAQ